MSDEKTPEAKPQAEKTIDEKVPASQDTAPTGGLEREDAQPTPYVVGRSTGMWGKGGTPDTSGYAGMQRSVEAPGVAVRPFGGWFDEVADRLEELTPGFGTGRVIVHRDELTLFVRPEAIAQVCRQLRDDPALRFEVLSVISGVHYPQQTGEELHVVYQLLSITHNRRLRLEVVLPDGHPHVDSVVSTYPMADFHEREAWDMFGIIFDGHPGLTRVLMPDDWSGHPQRKDYPLGGIPVEYKGATVPPPDQRRSY